MRRIRRRSRGQSTTEYMLAISVIVVAAVAATNALNQPIQEGFDTLNTKQKTFYAMPGGPQ